MKRTRVWTVCGVLLLACGCGSSEVPTAPPPALAPVSAPPPTPVARANPGAANGPPTAKTTAKGKPKADEGPVERLFDLTQDLNNFTVDNTPPAANLFAVNSQAREGSVVSVSQSFSAPEEEKAVPNGFVALPEFGFTEAGWPRRIRGEVDGKEMACVPAGLFTQGVDSGSTDASPAHSMSLDTYYIDVTEVTLGEFTKFKTAMSGKDGGPVSPVPLNGDPNRPVVQMIWKDAMNYAKWAGKELPTEAEWEKAGRGPDGAAFPWGSDRPIWTQPRRPGQIDSVGRFPHDRSRYGVLDLSGNVREWCSDWYSNTAYSEAKGKEGAPPHNWTGPRKASNGERVVKGGADRWELWVRGSHGMNKAAPDIGFRCVLR